MQQPQLNPKSSLTCRAWVYTIFHCDGFKSEPHNVARTRIDQLQLEEWFLNFQALYNDGRIRYAVGQLERCATTARLHIQLYVYYNQSVKIGRLKHLLKLPDNYGWADVRRGTHQQAIDYCKKEETRVLGPYEYGRAEMDQGKRGDLDSAMEAIKAGMDRLLLDP